MRLARRPIEPISYPIRAWFPIRKAQRIEEVTYDPLLYLARLLLSGANVALVRRATFVPQWRDESRNTSPLLRLARLNQPRFVGHDDSLHAVP